MLVERNRQATVQVWHGVELPQVANSCCSSALDPCSSFHEDVSSELAFFSAPVSPVCLWPTVTASDDKRHAESTLSPHTGRDIAVYELASVILAGLALLVALIWCPFARSYWRKVRPAAPDLELQAVAPLRRQDRPVPTDRTNLVLGSDDRRLSENADQALTFAASRVFTMAVSVTKHGNKDDLSGMSPAELLPSCCSNQSWDPLRGLCVTPVNIHFVADHPQHFSNICPLFTW